MADWQRHSHMMHPLAYDADCLRLLGKYLHHSPWPEVDDEVGGVAWLLCVSVSVSVNVNVSVSVSECECEYVCVNLLCIRV